MDTAPTIDTRVCGCSVTKRRAEFHIRSRSFSDALSLSGSTASTAGHIDQSLIGTSCESNKRIRKCALGSCCPALVAVNNPALTEVPLISACFQVDMQVRRDRGGDSRAAHLDHMDIDARDRTVRRARFRADLGAQSSRHNLGRVRRHVARAATQHNQALGEAGQGTIRITLIFKVLYKYKLDCLYFGLS